MNPPQIITLCIYCILVTWLLCGVAVFSKDEDYFYWAIICLLAFTVFQAGFGLGNSTHQEYIKDTFQLLPK